MKYLIYNLTKIVFLFRCGYQGVRGGSGTYTLWMHLPDQQFVQRVSASSKIVIKTISKLFDQFYEFLIYQVEESFELKAMRMFYYW